MSYKKYDADRSTRYTRKSLRLARHNYGWSGTYFVTIRAKVPGPLFDTPELRTILAEAWLALPDRYQGLTLDEFVIMPDHIHFIVRLEGNVEKPTSLGAVVRAYKSITTVDWLHHIEATGKNCRGRFWQDNCYERIIRDECDLKQTREYIRNNPAKLKASTNNELL